MSLPGCGGPCASMISAWNIPSAFPESSFRAYDSSFPWGDSCRRKILAGKRVMCREACRQVECLPTLPENQPKRLKVKVRRLIWLLTLEAA